MYVQARRQAGCPAPASSDDVPFSAYPEVGGQIDAAAALSDVTVGADLAAVFALPAPAQTTTARVDGVSTCTHHLPTGRLVLSVQESGTGAAAAVCFAVLRQRFAATRLLTGPVARCRQGGENPHGTVVVLNGDKVLVVDATGLPPVCGPRMIARVDLAREVATDVLGCWGRI